MEKGQKLDFGPQMFVEFEAMRPSEVLDISRFSLSTGQDRAGMTLYWGQLNNFSAER
jgi:hypothetical protein